MNKAEFNKNILHKGTFYQFEVCPYASQQSLARFCEVVVLSDQITEQTAFTHRRRHLAHVLPIQTGDSLIQGLNTHRDFITNCTRVNAPYVGCYDILTNEHITNLRKDGHKDE